MTVVTLFYFFTLFPTLYSMPVKQGLGVHCLEGCCGDHWEPHQQFFKFVNLGTVRSVDSQDLRPFTGYFLSLGGSPQPFEKIVRLIQITFP